MKTYEVTLPIAGHAYLTVEAETKEEALQKAFEMVTMDNIESWEALEQFNEGNFCYCPTPWEADAECVSEDDDEDESHG